MNNEPKADATAVCIEHTKKRLISFESSRLWLSWQPIMKRMLARSHEMSPVYEEICQKLGYSFKGNIPLDLVMETMWASGGQYNKDAISHKKSVDEELIAIQQDIISLCDTLASRLQKQKELLETEGFYRSEYLNIISVISLAGHGNPLFKWSVENELKTLKSRYEHKYWPSIAQCIEAIAIFERGQQPYDVEPVPESVLSGRASVIKNFVLSFDAEIEETIQIPEGFTISNKSLATVANVVLDIPVDQMATSDTVRVIRNRREKGSYS